MGDNFEDHSLYGLIYDAFSNDKEGERPIIDFKGITFLNTAVDLSKTLLAAPTDSDAVGALHVASYSSLLATCYDSDTLARALPHLTKANPTLLGAITEFCG